VSRQIVWDIRLPRSLGAWLGGALLGLAGAVAQGLFRNPLADPFLLGSASGASFGVALALALFGASPLATRFFFGKFSPVVALAVGWVNRALLRNPPSRAWDRLPACPPSGGWHLLGSPKRCHEEGDRLEAHRATHWGGC
jgi:ABC-type enterochelin transport system permease subunit